jgi:hypothetical protein
MWKRLHLLNPQSAIRNPAPGGDTTIVVKIIDMLGEEVLVIKEV